MNYTELDANEDNNKLIGSLCNKVLVGSSIDLCLNTINIS